MFVLHFWPSMVSFEGFSVFFSRSIYICSGVLCFSAFLKGLLVGCWLEAAIEAIYQQTVHVGGMPGW